MMRDHRRDTHISLPTGPIRRTGFGLRRHGFATHIAATGTAHVHDRRQRSMSFYRARPRDGIAWVTGASSGIGRAVALELVRRGYRVAVTARRVGELESLAAASGGRIDAFPGDVTDRAGMDLQVRKIEAESGPIALAFLNVGAFFPDASGDWAGDGLRRTLTVNFDGTINCFGPLIPIMKARGRGQIAVMASIAGYGGLPRAAGYCASKAALISLCESFRLPLERAGITMQVVCPGFVRTPLTGGSRFPMPFIIEVDEAARRICDGLETKGFEIAFPRRMAWLMKAFNMLPYPLYFGILRRGMR
jgi:NAD(P)-dependent dehydrogenase (short-subunit alcohol dehydrogenase family)